MRGLILGLLVMVGCGDDGTDGVDDTLPMQDAGGGPECAGPMAELHELVWTEVSGDCGPLTAGVFSLREPYSDDECQTIPTLDTELCLVRFRWTCDFGTSLVSVTGDLVPEAGDRWVGELRFDGLNPDGTFQCQSDYAVTATPF